MHAYIHTHIHIHMYMYTRQMQCMRLHICMHHMRRIQTCTCGSYIIHQARCIITYKHQTQYVQTYIHQMWDMILQYDNDTIWYDTIRCDAMRHDATRYHIILIRYVTTPILYNMNTIWCNMITAWVDTIPLRKIRSSYDVAASTGHYRPPVHYGSN